MTAMIIIVLSVTIVAALSVALAKVISGDGYGSGSRRPPASHLPDLFDPNRAH